MLAGLNLNVPATAYPIPRTSVASSTESVNLADIAPVTTATPQAAPATAAVTDSNTLASPADSSPDTGNRTTDSTRDSRSDRGAKAADNSAQAQAKKQAEALKLRELQQTDADVRAHEAAHIAVGGQYAGSVSYTFLRGSDGVFYAVAGEVPIDVSPIPGDPQATLAKAETVRRAALAPRDPSSADRRVAALAAALESRARQEIAQEQRQETGRGSASASLRSNPYAKLADENNRGNRLDLSA